MSGNGGRLVFIADSKVHARPADVPKALPVAPVVRGVAADRGALERNAFDGMRETLKNGGVQTVAVPQLFVTSSTLAAVMSERAEIQAGESMLEPNAGTCVLLDAARGRGAVTKGVELNVALCHRLRDRFDDPSRGLPDVHTGRARRFQEMQS